MSNGDQFKNAKGKDTTHFNDFIESLQNAQRGMETAENTNEFVKWQIKLNIVMDRFIKTQTLYFNQKYYVDFRGTDDELAKALGIKLSKEGGEDESTV